MTSNTDFSPLNVVPYNKDFIIDFVRFKANWDHRNEVTEKVQLQYLCKYLEIDHIHAKTIVVENEYVDRHYLEDYAEYYARCFPEHPRKCSRIHFFSSEFSESDFIDSLSCKDESFDKKLAKSYIGFAVIRPIPSTFIAKLCLKPYDALSNGDEYKILSQEQPVSLFGIPLSVATTPFTEQDKVVAACATSAIWTLLSATPQVSPKTQPSPSSITKTAVSSPFDADRTFPNLGLTPLQVIRSLKHFELEPTMLPCDSTNHGLENLKEIIHCYLDFDIPVLLGGSIYQKVEAVDAGADAGAVADADAVVDADGSSDKYKLLGRHFICVTGYRLAKNSGSNSPEIQLRSHDIDRIYVHDDRYGPYVKLDTNMRSFKTEDSTSLNGLELSLHDDAPDIFVPELEIIGLYHKVRLTYTYIDSMCDALFAYLGMTKKYIELRLAEKAYPAAEIPLHESVATTISNLESSSWDIVLTSNTKIKEELRTSDDFITFNGSSEIASLLVESLPKYIFRCRIFTSREDNIVEKFADVLFDATEVAQGRVVLGYITYTDHSEELWKYLERFIKENTLWSSVLNSPGSKKTISPFIKFFGDMSQDTYLNTFYGMLKTPARELKPGEVDEFKNIQRRADVTTIRRGSPNTDWMSVLPDKLKTYIWVINEMGDLLVGEDIAGSSSGFKGHPTLVDGKPARIGGELKHNKKTKEWEASLKSRAYSYYLKRGSETAKHYLNSVIKYNFVDLPVIAKY